MTDDILSIAGLRTSFFTDGGEVEAVRGIDLSVPRGTTTCIVGESGSGKSATARSIMQLVDVPGRVVGGSIDFRAAPESAPVDIAALHPRGAPIRAIRGKDIGMIFQEPMSALSPVHTVGDQIADVLRTHEGAKYKDPAVRRRIVEELELVGIPRAEERIDAYTFQLSGGMRQRVMIAMALISRPSLLIADEPTTALDVTTQAQILDLLRELKQSLSMSMLFITHDLGVVAEVADHVVVMRRGEIVERGSVEEIFHAPQHPYTRQLLDALPQRQAENGTSARRRATPSPPEERERPILEVRDLTVEFQARTGRRFGSRRTSTFRALDRVGFTLERGRTLGVVGESGCGKTTLGRTLLRAYTPQDGSIVYRHDADSEVDLAQVSGAGLLPYRRHIRMVFQDPYGSLNPRMTVEQVITEPLAAARIGTAAERREKAASLLTRVGLSPDALSRYPHAFSGGERQRIGIARALITDPRIVVADEAVSALDVSVRRQVLELFAELQEELDLTYVFISHDLSVVESISDHVAVMYYGRIVEYGVAEQVFTDPQHGYTRSLLSAIPVADPRERGRRERVAYRPEEGEVTMLTTDTRVVQPLK
ncbi:ABC transporter ATP-binding protein [Streptomyces sp. MS2A]|nr:ABC transporter ATP-binding protein [Streptomyces sp. MS2A]